MCLTAFVYTFTFKVELKRKMAEESIIDIDSLMYANPQSPSPDVIYDSMKSIK